MLRAIPPVIACLGMLLIVACGGSDPVDKQANNTAGLPAPNVSSPNATGAPPANDAAPAVSAPAQAAAKIPAALHGRWGLSPEQLEATREHQATVAYTRFVLDCGVSGDLLDLHVALTPCVIGYAEIAKTLVANIKQPLNNHPYREWIGEYAGDAYQAVAQGAREQLTRLAAKSMTAERFPELCGIFAKASRLEADFWQMALDNPAERQP